MIVAAAESIRVAPLGVRDPLGNPLFEQALARSYLIFDAYVSGERRVDLHPILLSATHHQEAVTCAITTAKLISQIAALAHQDEAEARCYGFSDDVRRLAAASWNAHDRYSLYRVDLLWGEDGFRACEINADCPGGHNEALGLPLLSQAAGFWSGVNPTTVVDKLCDALIELSRGEGAIALIYATAYAEDLQVCALIHRELQRRGVAALLASPTALRRKGKGLCIGKQKVSVLYRYFPTEYMEGQRNLTDILDAVATGSVRTLSNFAEMFTQSKLAFARAHVHQESLSPTEREGLRFVPVTYAVSDVSEEQLHAERPKWVLKRALGRVGEEVFVGSLLSDEDWIRVLAQAKQEHAQGEAWIVQAFVPQRPIWTPFGPRLLTLGAYVLNGRFCGYFARLTPDSHASHNALCLPVFVRSEPEKEP